MLNMTAQLLSTDKFDGLKDKIFPSDIFVSGGFRINNSVISGFIVVAVLLIVAVILRSHGEYAIGRRRLPARRCFWNGL